MKKYGLILMLLCLLTGCAGNDDFMDEVMSGQDCEVSFTPALVAVATKADPSSFLVKDTEVGISVYLAPLPGSEATDYTRSQLFKVTDDVGSLGPVGDAMVLATRMRYNFYAYTPAIGFDADSKKTISISHGVDFKIAQVATTTEKNTKIALPVMSRKCSLVQYYIKCLPDNKVVTDVRLGEGGLTMSGLTHSPVSYTLGDGEIKLDGVALDGASNIMKLATKTLGSEYYGVFTLLPKVSSEFGLSLNLVVFNRPMVLNATIPAIAFVPGRQYLYTVEISDDIIKVCLVLDWNSAAAGSSFGAPNAKIEVGSWGLTHTTNTSVGANNTSVTVSPWCVNTAWAVIFGAINSIGSVVGWNSGNFSINGGGNNTTTIITPWGTNNSSSTASSSNGSVGTDDWNPNNISTSGGANNTNSTTTSWGTGGATNSAGAANGGASVNGWTTGPSTSTTGGLNNAATIVTGWGVKSVVYVASSSNGGASVNGWTTGPSTSTSAGANNTNSTTTSWGTGGATNSAGAANGGASVNGWTTGPSTSTSAGANNTNSTTTSWGTAGATNSAGATNGGASVNGWTTGPSTSTAAGVNNTNTVTTPWGTAGATNSASSSNGSSSVTEWNTTTTTTYIGNINL